jgi:hypothetical protein
MRLYDVPRPLIAALAWVILFAGALAFAVPPTEAALTGSTINASNTFSSTALYSPGGLLAPPSGHSVALSWVPAAGNGNGNGYVINSMGNGINGATACPVAAASYVRFAAGVAGAAYTDAGAFATYPQGSYVCYLVRTGYSPVAPPWAAIPVWTSNDTLPTVNAQVGFVANSIAMANGNAILTAGLIDTGDVFTVTFNQPVVPTNFNAPAHRLCGFVAANRLGLAETACGGAEQVAAVRGGTLSSGTGADGAYTATYAWSNGNQTLTITVTGRVAGTQAVTVGAATWTLTPAATLTSATGGFAVCTANPVGGLCLPTTNTRP